jgi:hypothetical protein
MYWESFDTEKHMSGLVPVIRNIRLPIIHLYSLASAYKTRTWESKSYGIFFYFHPLLGNQDPQLTATLFDFNLLTFQNWISQPQYYCKWVSFVNGLCIRDVLPMIPADHREHFVNADGDLKVELPKRYAALDKRGVLHVTANGSNQTRQQKQKLSKKSDGNLVYISQSMKSIGGGRKTKYDEEEKFTIEAITYAWETGNPLSRSSVYEMLIAQFGGTESAWALTMKADSGFISASLSQWLTRVLERHLFSVRKESISQTVPLDWVCIAVEATGLLRQIMKDAGVTKLVIIDEVLELLSKRSTFDRSNQC